MEKTIIDFTPGKHLQCPVCGFEAIYTDARRRTVSYVIADGLTVDDSTTERDATVKHSDFTGIECNHIGCGWKGPALLPAGYAAAVEIETAYYRRHVSLSDAFADRTDNAGEAICRQYLVKATESLARLQSWAADPAAFDFSELSNVSDVCEVTA